MRKVGRILLIFLMAFSAFSNASSTKCTAKAAEVYYSRMINDTTLTLLRSGTGGKIGPIEMTALNGLIYSCEKGIENATYDTKTIWALAYQDATHNGVSEEMSKNYANSTVELYNFGKSLR